MRLNSEAAAGTARSAGDSDQRTLAAHYPGRGIRPQDGTSKTAVRTAWRNEISSRVDQILSGDVELVDANETYRLLSAELAETDG
jgi:hypothetical protein